MEITTLLLLAFVVERIVEILFGQPFDKVEKLGAYKWTLRYIALAGGVAVAVGYQVDMLAMLGLPEQQIGVYITGLVIGGGSQVVHDVVGMARK